MTTSTITILIVEDDPFIAEGIKKKVKKYNYSVCSIAQTGEEAVSKARDMVPDLILMDIKLEGKMDGIEAAEHIRKSLDIPVIYLTAYSDEEILTRARKTEPSGYLIKPIHERELHSIIEMAVHKNAMEKKLKKSHQWFSTTLNSIGDGVICTDDKGIVSFINPVAEEMTGWKKNECIKKHLEDIFTITNELSEEKETNNIKRVLKEEGMAALTTNTILIKKNGEKIPITVNAAPIRDENGTIEGTVFVTKDITEQKRAEDKIRKSLEEKDILLKEIHHRVKNNLAVVADFLYFQSEYAKDEETITMFKESQNRIKAMALIHEKLYDSKNLTKIDFVEYIEELGHTLIDAYSVYTDISLEVHMENIFLSLDTAIPFGILVNELVSNCCKHAFSGRKNGTISIGMHHDHEEKCILTIKDNGVGFPPGLDWKKTKSLGLEIVYLSAKKLKGSLDMKNCNGCEFTVTFNTLPYISGG